jgi:hypothetical protein
MYLYIKSHPTNLTKESNSFFLFFSFFIFFWWVGVGGAAKYNLRVLGKIDLKRRACGVEKK